MKPSRLIPLLIVLLVINIVVNIGVLGICVISENHIEEIANGLKKDISTSKSRHHIIGKEIQSIENRLEAMGYNRITVHIQTRHTGDNEVFIFIDPCHPDFYIGSLSSFCKVEDCDSEIERLLRSFEALASKQE